MKYLLSFETDYPKAVSFPLFQGLSSVTGGAGGGGLPMV